jgi:uroporphyrinogen decarboxylase
MNRREGITRVFHGERSERIPRALYGAGRWAYRQAGLKMGDLPVNPARFGDRLAGFLNTLDTDIVFAGSGLNTFPAEAIGGSLAFKDEQAPLLSFPLIEKIGDARYFREIDIGNSPHTQALVEMIAVLRQRLEGRFLCATSWGPFTWAMVLCDWSLLKDKTTTDREFIREVCELGVRLSTAFYGPLTAAGLIDGIAVPDGAVTLIPNDLYSDIVLPCECKLFDWARQQGVRSILHQCGAIRPQLSLYPWTRADCISVDASVPIGEVYDLYHGNTVTAGNVDAVNILAGGDPASICAAVSGCVTALSDPHRRFILMPSCDLPPDTPLSNVEAFLACADDLHLPPYALFSL